MNTLKTERRDLAEKAKKLRREGFITGNIFGHQIEGSIPGAGGKNVPGPYQGTPVQPHEGTI